MQSAISTRRTFLKMATGFAAAPLLPGRTVLAVETPKDDVLRHSMDRAAACCLAWLNPAQEHLPTGGYEIAHDTGRWWDAMLRYEVATGVSIPEPAETAMMRNLRILTGNPAALLVNSHELPIPSDKLKVNPHNLRETLLTYAALVKHRKSDWARRQGNTLTEVISKSLDPDGQMNYEKLAGSVNGPPLSSDPLMTQRASAGEWFNATGSTGRAIEALVEFYQVTHDGVAMEVAKRLAEVHFQQVIDPSGKIRAELSDPTHVGHTHSYCGTLRGLLLYGLVSGEKKYVEAVTATYRNGLWGHAISHSGWTPHDQGKIRFPDKEGDPLGEHASCGDIAQIALWLALRAGQTDLLDDVERQVRARLLPSQITDSNDPRRDGSWGVYSHPFGFGCILDVFAAVLHSLADFHQNVVTAAEDGTRSIHLHFDSDTPAIVTQCRRSKGKATLLIRPRERFDLRVRVPSWAPRESIQWRLGDKNLPLHWDGIYLTISGGDIPPGSTFTLQYDLPRSQTIEEMPISHRKFHLTWRGDEVVSCDPKVPMYPALS